MTPPTDPSGGALARAIQWLWPTRAIGARNSMRNKLMRVVALTTMAALLLSSMAILVRDLTRYRASQSSELATEGDILALASASALAFEDSDTARAILTALQARPAVLAAAVYDSRGRLFAHYARGGQSVAGQLPVRPPQGLRIVGEHIELTRMVIHNHEALGTIYLLAHYDVQATLRAYTGILGLVTLLSLAGALIFSTSLQRALMAPLDAMASVAHRVVDQRDYSLRVPKTTEDEVGVVVAAFNSMLDEVQARARALEQSNVALQLSETRFRSTFEIAAVGVANVSPAGRFLLVNDRLCDIVGYSREELLHTGFAEITHPQDLETDWGHVRDLLAGRSSTYSMEKRYVRKDGILVWVNLTVSLVRDNRGAPEYFISVIEDISQRKAAEAALLERERRFVALADAMPQLLWVSAPDGRIEYLNRRWKTFTRLSAEPASGNPPWGALIHPEDRERASQRWAHSLRTGESYEDEFRIRNNEASYRWFLARASADRDAAGQIVRWFGTFTDIDAAKRTEAHLRASETALREADHRKDVFIATLAHELRNPLAPLRVAARLLGSSELKPAQMDSTRAIIGRQVQHMALLLDDLLDVSRITRGALELKKDYVDVADSMAAAIETARPLIDSKRHRLTVAKPAQPIILEADPVRLAQIITNLLTNAAKYTDPEGEIVLSAQLEDSSIAISVRDSGIGLSNESLPKLFEMFSQVQAAGFRTEGGLGIGLALVKGLVELHGGRVEARSDGLGKGSEFVVHLQRSAQIASADVGPVDEARLVTTRAHRVLIADDNRDAADSLALFLRLSGHDVSIAYSGAEALSLATRLQPDLLLLDIGMAGMNGYELARRIRQSSWGTEAILIAITGWGQAEDRQRARASGFDYHMIKPIDPAAIQSRLHEIDQAAMGVSVSQWPEPSA